MISTKLNGRIGNQMFQYVITRIVALKHNYQFNIPVNGFLPINFFPNLDMGVPNFDENQVYIENNEQRYDPTVLNVNDNTLLIGFWQTEKYFSGYEKQIKEWFHVDNLDIDNIDNICFIHFRGGDYKNSNQFLPKEYYDLAKSRMLSENPNMIFHVITDDIDLAKETFKNDIIIENSNDLFDFRVLKSAKYLIISNSTFSWWAGWLNDNKKLILAPEKWYNFKKETDVWFPYDIYTPKFEYVLSHEYLKKKKKISIIMQSYLVEYNNRTDLANKFRRAVNSFLKQDYDYCELVIVSDGCEQTTNIYFEEYRKYENIKFVFLDKKNAKNMYEISKGITYWRGFPRNVGIGAADGDIIAYIDADDFILPNFASSIIKAYENNPDKDWMVNMTWYESILGNWINTDMSWAIEIDGLPSKWIEVWPSDDVLPMSTWTTSHKSTINVKWEDTSNISDDSTFVEKLITLYPNYGKHYDPIYAYCHTYDELYDI